MSLVRPGAAMSTVDRTRLDTQYRAAQAQKRYSSPTSAPKRLSAPVSTEIKKPNLLAQVYNALLSIPTPAPAGVGVPSRANNPLAQTVEPVRVAARRAVGDITAIPGVGKPSASPTATDIKQGNYVGPIMDYANLALAVAPVAAKGLRKPQSAVAKQVPDETVVSAIGNTTKERLPSNRITRSDDIKMVDFGNNIEEPLGSIDIRSYNPNTNEMNGVVSLHFNQGQPALLSSMYAKSPTATTQLISAARRIAKELLPNMEYPVNPSSSLSPHSYVFVKRLMDAGLIDPNFALPAPQFLNSMSLRNIDELLEGWKASAGSETVINPLYYLDDYQSLRAALANAQRNRTQRPISARQLEQRARENQELPTIDWQSLGLPF